MRLSMVNGKDSQSVKDNRPPIKRSVKQQVENLRLLNKYNFFSVILNINKRK